MSVTQQEVKEVKRKRRKTVWCTNQDTVAAWLTEEYEYGKNKNETIFFGEGVIYSYGHHFPLAARITDTKGKRFYLVNGDAYSVTTSQHQSQVRGAIDEKSCIIVPFSALNEARIDPSEIRAIDREPDKWVRVPCKDSNGKVKERKIHLMGSSLFQDKEGRRWLSGLDESALDPWGSFFLTELMGTSIRTVKDAYFSLVPEAVVAADIEGKEIKRQGEWFFVKIDPEEKRSLRAKGKKRWFTLMHPSTRTGHHTLTRAIVINGKVYGKGTCRHNRNQGRPEHRMIRLEDWYRVYPNQQVRSFGARGRVD